MSISKICKYCKMQPNHYYNIVEPNLTKYIICNSCCLKLNIMITPCNKFDGSCYNYSIHNHETIKDISSPCIHFCMECIHDNRSLCSCSVCSYIDPK